MGQHYDTYQDLLRSTSAPVKGEKLVPKTQPEPEETPEVAKLNRWFTLKDGSMIAIKKGDELPAAETIEKTATQKEFNEWKESKAPEPEEAASDEGKA